MLGLEFSDTWGFAGLRHLEQLTVFGLVVGGWVLVGEQAGGDAQGLDFFSDALYLFFFYPQNFFDAFHDRSLGWLDLEQLDTHGDKNLNLRCRDWYV
jgi:hypothetical protein